MAEALYLGVFGYGKVDGVQVLFTGGTMSREHTISYINPMSIPPPDGIGGGQVRGKVQFSDGTLVVNGSCNFDINSAAMNLINTTRLLKRGYQFPMEFHDGNSGYRISNCYVRDLTINGTANGLISASVSLTGGPRKGFKEIIDIVPMTTYTASNVRDKAPIGYWASGNENVQGWTLAFSQDVVPMYLNGISDQDDRFPRYIKVGVVSYVLTVTTYQQVFEHDEITISTKSFQIIGKTESTSYNFEGPDNVGTYTHVFQSSSVLTTGSGGDIILSV